MVNEKNLPRARADKAQVKQAMRDKGVDASVGIGADGTPVVYPRSEEAARKANEKLGELGLLAEVTIDPGDIKGQS